MQPDYQSLYDRSRGLQDQFHNTLGDNQYNPMAQVLRTEIHNLTDDLEMKKAPRDIESRIQTIQRSFLEMQNNGTAPINAEHAAGFHTDYEHMRMDVRRLPHY